MATTAAKALLLPLLFAWTTAHGETCAQTLKLVQQLYNDTANGCANGEPALNCSGLTLRGTTRADPAKGEQWDVWTYSPQALKLGASSSGANGEAQAAYNCSGLIVRGTKRPEYTGGKPGDFHVWETSPTSRQQGTISAAYMRSDVVFRDLTVKGEANQTEFVDGFILTPPWKVADEKDRSYPDCGFPIDGWGYDRSGKGCGDNSKTAEVEASCASLGVDGQNWTGRYFEPHKENDTHLIGGKSCAFDMQTTNGAESSEQFRQFLIARRAMQNVPNQDVAFNSYTEVRYTNPPSNESAVWAFFYSDDKGKDAALKNQAEYKQKKGIDVPVIRIQYPQDKNGKASFSCAAEPVTGNSTKCEKYTDEVKVINRWDPGLNRYIDSISVKPSACARDAGPEQNDAAMAEIKSKVLALPDGARIWGDRDATLRRQYVCHKTLVENGLPVSHKEFYNLEPARSYVSHEQSIKDKCNTVATDDKVIGGWGPNGSPQCTQYVSSVKWVTRKFAEYGDRGIISLEVTPSECGRKVDRDDKPAMDALMAEIKKKALAADKRGAEYWGNKDPSMRKQTGCLGRNFEDKPTWNIESIRPNELSDQQYDAAQCNPK